MKSDYSNYLLQGSIGSFIQTETDKTELASVRSDYNKNFKNLDFNQARIKSN